jgi:hypothetical protein
MVKGYQECGAVDVTQPIRSVCWRSVMNIYRKLLLDRGRLSFAREELRTAMASTIATSAAAKSKPIQFGRVQNMTTSSIFAQ